MSMSTGIPQISSEKLSVKWAWNCSTGFAPGAPAGKTASARWGGAILTGGRATAYELASSQNTNSSKLIPFRIFLHSVWNSVRLARSLSRFADSMPDLSRNVAGASQNSPRLEDPLFKKIVVLASGVVLAELDRPFCFWVAWMPSNYKGGNCSQEVTCNQKK